MSSRKQKRTTASERQQEGPALLRARKLFKLKISGFMNCLPKKLLKSVKLNFVLFVAFQTTFNKICHKHIEFFPSETAHS